MSTNTNKPITRFAPSPTGYLHIGGARTALYNFLFAKKHGGKFILRIEDTDLERSTPESTQAILDGMNWLGLNHDEGPFFQTERFHLYEAAIEKLITEKKAYPCFCKAEELDVKRKQAQAQKHTYHYDRACLKNLSDEERERRRKSNEPHVVRFFSHDDEWIVINDLIKGEVKVNTNELGDWIIRRPNGSPTYNFSVVIDDASMNITHVIRGDDHLSNTPAQIQLYNALGYALPQFGHLPMILGADKTRLSKRHGATSVMAYREMGYLPQAILNYLLKLGWGHGDQEIFSMQEMIDLFSLEKCSPSSSIFNPQKLDWMNGHYIRESSAEALQPLVLEFLEKAGLQHIDKNILTKAIESSKEKVKTLKELADRITVYFDDAVVEPAVVQKNINDQTKPILKRVCEELEKCSDTSPGVVHKIFESLMTELGVGLGQVANPTRVAIAGRTASPGAMDLIGILGKKECVRRIKRYF